jgi:hypothetical protein
VPAARVDHEAAFEDLAGEAPLDSLEAPHQAAQAHGPVEVGERHDAPHEAPPADGPRPLDLGVSRDRPRQAADGAAGVPAGAEPDQPARQDAEALRTGRDGAVVSACAADGEHQLPGNPEALRDALEPAREAGLQAARGRQRLGRLERAARESGERRWLRAGRGAASLDAGAATLGGGAATLGSGPAAFGGGAAVTRPLGAAGSVVRALLRRRIVRPLGGTPLRRDGVRRRPGRRTRVDSPLLRSYS